MSEATRVGIVGCGNISTTYFRNAALFPGLAVVACADMRLEAARSQAEKFGAEAMDVEALLKRPDIELVVNLTVPNAHYAVSMAAIEAGKHVFSEKPLATSLADGRALVAAAKAKGVKFAVAPDTILGPGHQNARRLVDEGTIGTVLSGAVTLASRGMEHWHPDPEFFFKPGGGPVLDMGPYYLSALVNLIGPIRRISARTAIGYKDRIVTAEGPRKGDAIPVETPTSAFAILEFASGAFVTMTMSWDVWKHGRAPIEIYGTEGSLRNPDPNFYGGRIDFNHHRDEWQVRETAGEPCGAPNFPWDAPANANYRMLGVADLAEAARQGRRPRMDADIALHVLEVMLAVLDSGARDGALVSIQSSCERPAALSAAQCRALMGLGA